MSPAPIPSTQNRMVTRIAELADAEGIVELINAAFVVERFFIDRDRTDLTEIHGLFQKGTFLVAGERGNLEACAYLEPRNDRAYLGLLSIRPAKQRSGLGSKFMAAVEKHASQIGCRHMDLRVVNVRLELPGFYRKLGYSEIGRSPFHSDIVTLVPCHFIHMSKELKRQSPAPKART